MTKGWLLLIFVLGLLLAFSVAVGSATASPGILYAKPSASGSGNCSNWGNACTLQTALGTASDGDEIWVAEGTHKPTTGTDRTATFQLVNGVEVYGGFAGTETSRDERDWQSNVTVLSGDIDDNDITDPNDVVTTTANITGTNSYHVVTSNSVTETRVLDGFTITGGNANGSQPNDRGGGMYNDGGSPTLTNVTFSGNSARSGGGMGNESSSPTLTGIAFSGNSAGRFSGGGMGNWGNSSPTLVDVTFSGNSAGLAGGGMLNWESNNGALTNVIFDGNSATYGGGIYNETSSPTLTNVIFSGNSAKVGGGMANYRDSSPSVTNVTFSGNSAINGGGMYNSISSSPTLANVTFSGNSASNWGGGMCQDRGDPTLTNVTFSGNSADYGGGIRNYWSSPTLTNITFSGNSAAYDGGGMYNWYSTAALTNVTFSGNSATDNGGGMYSSGSNPTVANSVLWGNTAISGTQIYNYGSSAPAISYSLVQASGGSGSGWDANLGSDGGGNIDADPQFVDADGPDDIVGTLDDNLRLWFTSPAIDAGDNSALPADSLDLDGDGNITETLPFDLDGCPRILMDTVDMGAYEWPLCLTLTKTVINDDGGTATAGDFQAYIQGTPVPWSVGQSVISGTYTVSETVQAGYSASAWSGDCAPDGTITLALDEHAACSVTNDDIAPTLTLTKTVINDDDGTATLSDFQAYLDGDLVPWGVPQPVTSGTHTASESVLLGYVPTLWGGDCNEDGTITLNVGEDALCSITNDDTLHTYVPLALKNYRP